MATPSFKVITQALAESMPQVTKSKNWRDALGARIGTRGEKIWEILADLAEGKAWMAQLPDGQISIPVIPSSDVRLRAAIALAEMKFGKAVAQTEILKAEAEASEMESIRALSDAELEAEATKILAERRMPVLVAGPEVDAEIVPDQADQDDPFALIWEAEYMDEP